jgi:hypothetical protein
MRSFMEPAGLATHQFVALTGRPATKARMAERILRAASDEITEPTTLTAMAIDDCCRCVNWANAGLIRNVAGEERRANPNTFKEKTARRSEPLILFLFVRR